MTAPEPQPNSLPVSQTASQASGLVMGFARHWLIFFNLAWLIYVVTPFLAPVFMQIDWTAQAQVVYLIYSYLCHQLPDHSYFLFGPTFAPQETELIAGGMSESANLFAQRAFIGSPEVGWKVALCQRDVAIYAAVLLTGMLYGLVRNRMRPLPFKYYVLFLIPIAIDGGTQLIGWRESNWFLRTVTGALFGFASVWLAYPYVEDAMADVMAEEQERARRAAMQQRS